MLSPTALAAHAGSDNAQTYLQTHDIGTGPYTLSEAKVGVTYQLKAYPNYWGSKPYYTTVNLPVIDNLSTEEIEFNTGQMAAILHDMTTSASVQYKGSRRWPLRTSDARIEMVYVNENKGFMTTARTARPCSRRSTFPPSSLASSPDGPRWPSRRARTA